MPTRLERDRLTRAVKRCFWVASSAAALLFLGYGTYLGWNELSRYPWSIDYRWLVSSLPAYWGALVLAIVNWDSIVSSLGVKVGFRRNMKLYCLTNLSKQLPTIFWFVGARVLVYEREGVPKAVTSAGIVLELALLTLSNAIVCALVLPALPALQPAQKGLVLALSSPLLLIVVRPGVLIRVMNGCLTRLGRSPLRIGLRRQQMVLWCTLYSGNWILGGLFLYLLIRALHPAAIPHPFQIIGAWALSGLVSKLRFVLPIGIGWSEVSLAYLLSFFMPLPSAVVITVLSRIWLALNEASWFLISLGL